MWHTKVTDLEKGDSNGVTLPLLPAGNINNNADQIRRRPVPLALRQPSPPHSLESSPSILTATDPFPKKFRRSDRRLRRLNTELLEALESKDIAEIEGLLCLGANPNATCRISTASACHMACAFGGGTLQILIQNGADTERMDRLGRTPLHLAIWFENKREVAALLGVPEEIWLESADKAIDPAIEEKIRKFSNKAKSIIDKQCEACDGKPFVPKEWRDDIDHDCFNIDGTLPELESGWTPLHVASARVRVQGIKFLLAAGADPNIEDHLGRTPLDVAGIAHQHDVENDKFTEVIKLLLNSSTKHNTMRITGGVYDVVTPLHVAAELNCTEAITLLLDYGVSVACRDVNGLTPLHVCVLKQADEAMLLLANSTTTDDPLTAIVDVRDRGGHTVLQTAVVTGWVTGVCIALEAGAEVTLKANDGETPIHSAAKLGNLDILTEILSVAKQKTSLDYKNDYGETPLICAIKHGHLECTRAILDQGASANITLPDDVNVIHIAVEHGHSEILEELLDQTSPDMINAISQRAAYGLGPIHYAVLNKQTKCVEILLNRGADVRLRTTSSPYNEATPLHLAALINNAEIAKIILHFDRTTIHEMNGMGFLPLHVAAHYGSRDIIPVLLQSGADLSGYTDGPAKFRRTAIDMLVNNMSKPTDYLEDLLDTYISTNTSNLQDVGCVVTLDYSVLIPRGCAMKQMKVIEKLMATGNRYGQRKLLVHPLIESFLYFKWKAVLPFFYTILLCYALFLCSTTVYVVSVFFYKDTHTSTPVWLNSDIWSYIMFLSIVLLLFEELLYMNLKSGWYFLQAESLIKFGSISLATSLPFIVSYSSYATEEWPRHVATAALLLAWIEMMYLLSRFPNWGYYVLMFGAVAKNLMKILFTFGFLIIGFSLSFMIQFHSLSPFDTPWSALVKTLVMMTSEFDYQAIFDEEHVQQSKSILISRVIFVVFIILAAIVLMNLMVGVAVNDINYLEVIGNVQRLAKQVDNLGSLDVLAYNKFFSKVLPKKLNEKIRESRKVDAVVQIYPGRPKWKTTKMLPNSLRDSILNKASAMKKQIGDQTFYEDLTKKINTMHEKLLDIDSKDAEEMNKLKLKDEEILKHIEKLSCDISHMKDDISNKSEVSNIDIVNDKLNNFTKEIDSFKELLLRLESKIDKLQIKS